MLPLGQDYQNRGTFPTMASFGREFFCSKPSKPRLDRKLRRKLLFCDAYDLGMWKRIHHDTGRIK